ncbi:MAG TPA: glycoside hydrolase family 2 TIM barrel-domain containing protein [Chitinophagaceae bacterium]|nr:glycoside hydrolase family 2 TIM barrel-domain containing protein [Chitinophagaceae bacterium]
MSQKSLHFFAGVLLLLPVVNVCAQTGNIKQVQLKSFSLQSSAVITDDGSTISGAGYTSANYWFPVKVPSTVLTGLVVNGVYPDPYIGMNNMLIPDASDSFNHEYHLEKYSFLPNEPNPWKKPYWYRTAFNVPATDRGRHFQLIFKGINYRADVWVNGKQVADSAQMAGMFAEYSFDISSLVKADGANAVAVKIYPLDYPGLPAHPQLDALGDFYANGGPTGDIGKNVTMLCSVGWDWMPEVHDRNMGIWQPVYLRTSGNVTIQHAHIVTELPGLPDTNTAKLSLQLSLNNFSASAQNGKLRISVSPENFNEVGFSVDKNIALEGNSSKEVSLTASDIQQFIIHHPKLWWPNGYGTANLYRIRLQYTDGASVLDDTSFIFGIRTVSSKTTIVDGWVRRDFFVNGERVHLVGGAWVPDMMLNRDSLRYDYELHLCRNANVNLVRIWGGGIAEPDIFFELADRYGLMVWQDFWITGDTHGEFKGSAEYPYQGDVYIRNILSTILRIRNHPSLLVWTGGNEGHARQELYNAMRDNIALLDGTRPFIPSSSGFAKQPAGWKGSWPDDQPSGVYSGGPYSWQDAAQYYRLADRGRDWVFKDETGIPSQPPYASLPKIISNLVPDTSLPYPLNNTWGYHDACSGNGHYELYYKAMVTRYGAPATMKEFCDKMQLVNANGYRGIFEAAGHKLNETGGVMLWKLNAAFPSVIWQVYDWYLEPNAGYYFMQRACEPVHVQLNLDDSAVAVINRTYAGKTSLTAETELFDINGMPLYKHSGNVSVAASGAKEVFKLSGQLSKEGGLVFVVLRLKNAAGKTISHNEYWIEPKHNFTGLNGMKAATVQAKIISAEKGAANENYTIQFTNKSGQLAFFINPQIRVNGEEVMPCFWSDNYFSLKAGETTTLTVSCPLQKLAGHIPALTLEGWNITHSEITLTH